MGENPAVDAEASTALLCACGCGEPVEWKGFGRKPKYANAGHQSRDAQRKFKAKRTKKDPLVAEWEHQLEVAERHLAWFEGHGCEHRHSAAYPECPGGCQPMYFRTKELRVEMIAEQRGKVDRIRGLLRPCHPLCDRHGSVRQCHDIASWHLRKGGKAVKDEQSNITRWVVEPVPVCDGVTMFDPNCCSPQIPGTEGDWWDEESRSWQISSSASGRT